MSHESQEQIAPLLTTEGWELLASLGPYREAEAFSVNADLRKAGHSPELVAAVLTQSRLRTRAEAKFGEFARQMLFTRPDSSRQPASTSRPGTPSVLPRPAFPA